MGMTSGAAARMLGVSSKTLLLYSNQGLLHPVRSTGGWRYFQQAELEQFAKSRAKRFGKRDKVREGDAARLAARGSHARRG